MAKVSICDICKYQDDKLVESVWRRGYKGFSKLDFCEKHKDYDMGKTAQEFARNATELLYGKPTVEIEVVNNPKMQEVK